MPHEAVHKTYQDMSAGGVSIQLTFHDNDLEPSPKHKTKKDGPDELPSGTQDLSSRGRPVKRWEDDLNEYVKDEENNKALLAAKMSTNWKRKKERQYAKHVIND